MLFILVVQNRSKEFDDKKIIKLEQANTRGIKQDKTDPTYTSNKSRPVPVSSNKK